MLNYEWQYTLICPQLLGIYTFPENRVKYLNVIILVWE